MKAGARYVDGGVTCYPRDVGQPVTSLIYCGGEGAFNQHKELLQILGGNQYYFGPKMSSAKVVYDAVTLYLFVCLNAYFHGAVFARQGDVGPAQFADLVQNLVTPIVLGCVKDAGERIESGNYEPDQAAVDVYEVGIGATMNEIARANGRADIPQALQSFYAAVRDAQAQGQGNMDIAVLYNNLLFDN